MFYSTVNCIRHRIHVADGQPLSIGPVLLPLHVPLCRSSQARTSNKYFTVALMCVSAGFQEVLELRLERHSDVSSEHDTKLKMITRVTGKQNCLSITENAIN